MAVELMGFPKMDDHTAIQEAASQGLKSMEHLIRVINHQSSLTDCTNLTDVTVSKFKKMISLLNRTGHARFRRSPVLSSSASSSSILPDSLSFNQASNRSTPAPPMTSPSNPLVHAPVPVHPASAPVNVPIPSGFVQSQPKQSLTLDFSKPTVFTGSNPKNGSEFEFTKDSFSVSSSSSFMSSAITGDGSVSNGKQGSIFLAPAAQPANSAGKPPISAVPYKKRCLEHDHSDDVSGKMSGSSNGKCHCSKKRYFLTLMLTSLILLLLRFVQYFFFF